MVDIGFNPGSGGDYSLASYGIPDPMKKVTAKTDIGFAPQGLDQYGPGGLASKGLQSSGGGFDWSNAMDNFSMGAQGVLGLANAYTAYKQLGLMEDQLNMQKGMANRNIANQAATTNRMLDDRSSMAAQMTSGADYGTPEYLKAKKELQTTVDGSPVA